MKFRVARHTDNLEPLVHFYCNLLGLQVLGEFKDHNDYDGIFLGLPGLDWHLEFTTSRTRPVHHPDQDDLLVFYMKTKEELPHCKHRLEGQGILPVQPTNPYWGVSGATFEDPDGYRVVLALQKTE